MPETSHTAVRRVAFHRTKYGTELLLDVGRIPGLAGFIRDTRPHSLSFYDLFLVTGGHGTLLLDEAEHEVSPGRVFFTAPGQVRRWFVDELQGVCLFFEGEFLERFFNDTRFLQKLRLYRDPEHPPVLAMIEGDANRLRDRMLQMEEEISSWKADDDHILRAMLYETLATLDRSYRSRFGTPDRRAENSTVARFCSLLHERFREERRVRAYASALGVSPDHLSSLTRAQLGRTAGQMIRDRRTLEAKRLLLHTDRSVAGIAGELGFRDTSYFSRFFRREVGETPLSYRERRPGPYARPTTHHEHRS